MSIVTTTASLCHHHAVPLPHPSDKTIHQIRSHQTRHHLCPRDHRELPLTRSEFGSASSQSQIWVAKESPNHHNSTSVLSSTTDFTISSSSCEEIEEIKRSRGGGR